MWGPESGWGLVGFAALYHSLQMSGSVRLWGAAAPLLHQVASSSLPAGFRVGSVGEMGAGGGSLGLNWAKYCYSHGSFTYVWRSDKMSL